MKAMVLYDIGQPLVMIERPDPSPLAGDLLVKVEACAVCRADLHVVDGDLKNPKLPLVPGHEIVGIVEAVGEGVSPSRLGSRVGIPWLGHTCGHCDYCRSHSENLCDDPLFTGYTRDGGFATHAVADANFAFDLPTDVDPVSFAPLLCAGLIGWRSLKMAGKGRRIGLYGFGAAAHIIAQVCIWQGREVYAFTTPGDLLAQDFAKRLGATWAGGSDRLPRIQLDAAIIFAPVGDLVPLALRAVKKAGTVVCGGIHMSDIPSMPYATLWGERSLKSVANLTRSDAVEFFSSCKGSSRAGPYDRLPSDRGKRGAVRPQDGTALTGAAVLVP